MNRMLRFKLPDESLKTIIVNETKVLGEILKIICNRCGMIFWRYLYFNVYD